MPCGRSSVAVPLADPPPDDAVVRVPADVADRERVDVAFFGADRDRPAPPEARVPVDRRDEDDLPDLEAELLVVLFFPLLLFGELFLLVLLLPVLRLELLFAVALLELLFAVLLLAVLLLELLFVELFLPALFLPVLRLELLFAGLFLPVLLELLLAVFLLELLFAVLLLPVLLAPERFFAPLRFRDEPPRPPFDSASMSSSFRIREAPAIPARVARFRSSATVMSSKLRATSAPSPIVPSTCAVATPVLRPLITRPSGAPLDPGAEASRHARDRRPLSRGAGYTGREPCVAATEAPPTDRGSGVRVWPALTRERTARGGWSTGSRRAGRGEAGGELRSRPSSAERGRGRERSTAGECRRGAARRRGSTSG
jgi:hypothetical protein